MALLSCPASGILLPEQQRYLGHTPLLIKFAPHFLLDSGYRGPIGSKKSSLRVQVLFKPLFASLFLPFHWPKWVPGPAYSQYGRALLTSLERGRGITWVHFLQYITASILKWNFLGSVEKQFGFSGSLLSHCNNGQAYSGVPPSPPATECSPLPSSSACSAPREVYVYSL